jgi:hypothetical protein
MLIYIPEQQADGLKVSDVHLATRSTFCAMNRGGGVGKAVSGASPEACRWPCGAGAWRFGRTGALCADRVGFCGLRWALGVSVYCRLFGCSAARAGWAAGGLLVGQDDGGSDGLCDIGVVDDGDGSESASAGAGQDVRHRGRGGRPDAAATSTPMTRSSHAAHSCPQRPSAAPPRRRHRHPNTPRCPPQGTASSRSTPRYPSPQNSPTGSSASAATLPDPLSPKAGSAHSPTGASHSTSSANRSPRSSLPRVRPMSRKWS